ncbi:MULTISPECIES: dTMP kinase [unclassified Curtobacterium]|uniref:dTMP kinase n=1 Tax=unclassified Curtobacterium TaxID=257496 RepID=UPI00052AD435|nr:MULTISPECIES: dTMP kinase [unclassified Curtobacterium]AIV40504.1 thymidylate kinase [Curtobacterium sp. MR_MD2014]MBP1302345.1 dTMP kinase [Curtobacterium sp. 1310]MCM3520143.1 dTMP kinase [Curtobacterium sp. P97]MDB6425681.1 dTMP kinase [Curtobacterium sp. 20TX0008]MDT0211911.1 dTMP kinase [Curtobacterium sp. BRD11]
MTGRFITLEGGDGAGKTTQAELLSRWLEEHGRTVVRTREPGGTELGQRIREMVLHERGHVSARAEALLYAADRAHHVETVVRPALARGEVVLQDRYIDSSVAYQGVARGLGAERIRSVSDWAADGLLPDLTVLLDLDVTVGRSRVAAARGDVFDRLESEAASFHETVRRAFLDAADAEPERFLVVDAGQPADTVHRAVRAAVGAVVGIADEDGPA